MCDGTPLNAGQITALSGNYTGDYYISRSMFNQLSYRAPDVFIKLRFLSLSNQHKSMIVENSKSGKMNLFKHRDKKKKTEKKKKKV